MLCSLLCLLGRIDTSDLHLRLRAMVRRGTCNDEPTLCRMQALMWDFPPTGLTNGYLPICLLVFIFYHFTQPGRLPITSAKPRSGIKNTTAVTKYSPPVGPHTGFYFGCVFPLWYVYIAHSCIQQWINFFNFKTSSGPAQNTYSNKQSTCRNNCRFKRRIPSPKRPRRGGAPTELQVAFLKP